MNKPNSKPLAIYKAASVVAASIVLLFLTGCKDKEVRQLNIVSWNLQTFFDAVEDGSEYKEFRGNKTKWDEDAYKERLVRLCRAMKTMNADIYVFMEIENENVLRDGNNMFATLEWGSIPWRYACFSRGKGSAIGCAVLSRYPLSEITMHDADVRVREEQPAMRGIMCVRVADSLVLLVNHWKSKVGGENETRKWRKLQEGMLSSLFLFYADEPVIACGDFNQDLDAFDDNGTSLILHGVMGEGDAEAASAWNAVEADSAPGSYYYKGKWERLDHVFYNKRVILDKFAALDKGEWATEEGIPRRYNLRNRTGYSDHLPIMAIIHW